MSDYPAFGKIPRFHKEAVITEKIDGTNGLVGVRTYAGEQLGDGEHLVHVAGADGIESLVVRAGSRNRWLVPGKQDNHGFAAFVADNATQLALLGVGNHYGEWFGKGIQRGYGMTEKRFALFNIARWYDPNEEDAADVAQDFPKAQPIPECVTTVPVLWAGNARILNDAVVAGLALLARHGSIAAPDFDRPEGLIVYHVAAGQYFKVLVEGDETPKSLHAQLERVA